MNRYIIILILCLSGCLKPVGPIDTSNPWKSYCQKQSQAWEAGAAVLDQGGSVDDALSAIESVATEANQIKHQIDVELEAREGDPVSLKAYLRSLNK